MKAKFVELHILQSFPPSCVNRDGNNSPKDCVFGDVRRARISSQCLKRAIRTAESFKETLDDEIAVRSKRMRDEKLIPYLTSKGLAQADAEKVADEFRKLLAKGDSKKQNLTSVGLYFGDEELFALVDAFQAGEKDFKKVTTKKSADVALFGRMLAENTSLNVDAAAQVAHAISTHKLSQNLDYWTAADDLQDSTEDEAGAGAAMLGTAEFNASVFYRYACVSLNILESNLGDEEIAKRTIEAFIRASYDAIPTGKQNGHGHNCPPYAMLAVVRRKGMPLNLCNAFIKPVKAEAQKGIDESSAKELREHLNGYRKLMPVDDASYFSLDPFHGKLGGGDVKEQESFSALVDSVLGEI
jgi:CRISPR system Cascade subunit CasC